MKKIIIFLLLFLSILLLYSCCKNHECCQHTKDEKERNDFIQSLTIDQLGKYNKCIENHYVEARIKCDDNIYSDVLVERKTQSILHNACIKAVK
jgi:hypothetical protein